MRQSFETFFNRRLNAVLLLGFSAGLPIALTTSTLQAWFSVSGVDIVTIGFLGLIGLPYVFKFLWAPLLDRYTLPFLGRRRSWMLLMQLALVVTLVLMALLDPQFHPFWLGLLAFVVAIFSATQDVAIDAYRVDILPEKERGMGAAYAGASYRIAMLVSGGVALVLADYVGWRMTYISMAGLLMVGMLAAISAPEPEYRDAPPSSLLKAVVEPFREFLSRDNAIALVALIILYKLGDAFAVSLTTPFLLQYLHFSLTEVGSMIKIVGILASLIGIFMGGFLMIRMKLFQALLFFGFLQALSNLLFMLLAIVGKQYVVAVTAIFMENFCSGMGTAAFLALLMSLCDQRFSATQYALLSALSAIGRVLVGPAAGLMVKQIGWVDFYFWTFIVALPGLFLLWWLRQDLGVKVQDVSQ